MATANIAVNARITIGGKPMTKWMQVRLRLLWVCARLLRVPVEVREGT